MKNFALIGASGYIAPRHMKAIKETGNNLVVALDKNDSVGIIDSYFPDADFFTEYERFDRHIEKMKRMDSKNKIDYISICSPNYLHDSHIRFALRIGAEAICEKPLVLNPWNIEALKEIEAETGKKINSILQLRLHPEIIKLKKRVEEEIKLDKDKVYEIDLTTITARGHWYNISWKGEIPKSGGIVTNIGIHNFDMLLWIFGAVKENRVDILEQNRASGYLKLENANIKWLLSIDRNDLPKETVLKGSRFFRMLKIDDDEIEFEKGFTDLHTLSYQEILKGNGFSLDDALPSIDLVHKIRNS